MIKVLETKRDIIINYLVMIILIIFAADGIATEFWFYKFPIYVSIIAGCSMGLIGMYLMGIFQRDENQKEKNVFHD